MCQNTLIATQEQQISTQPIDQTQDIRVDEQAVVPSTPMASDLKSKVNANTEIHDLKAMLERFVYLETVTWSGTDTVLPQLYEFSSYTAALAPALRTYAFPAAIIERSQLHQQKLNNFYYMKADIEIELQVNAEPFQQGALCIAYYPKNADVTPIRSRTNETLAGVTSAPHRILYLEEGNSCKMTFPYAAAEDYLDLTDFDSARNTFGLLSLYVLSSLDGPTSDTQADITISARFVNIELNTPVDNSVYLNASIRNQEIARLQQLARNFKAEINEGEAEGPVTKIANKVGTVASWFEGVPILGTAAKTVGWLSRITAGVATVFGYSKPTDCIAPIATVARPAAYMGNVEGKDNSFTLAQIVDNAIVSDDMNPAKVDEMALDYLCRKPIMTARTTITKDLFKSKQLLFSFTVSPITELSALTETYGFCLGTWNYVTSLYKFWRGAIECQIDIVKTQFHSGRIMLVYFPNLQRTDIPDTFNETMTTNLNIVYDLKSKDMDGGSLSRTFTIPYTSNLPWKQTIKSNDFQPVFNSLDTNNGCVGVYCLNELVCPDTVAQSVTFLLTQRGGEDYEVAVPQLQTQTGYLTNLQNYNALVNEVFRARFGSIFPAYVTAAQLPLYVEGETPNFVAEGGDPSGTNILISQNVDDAIATFFNAQNYDAFGFNGMLDGTYSDTFTVRCNVQTGSGGPGAVTGIITTVISDGKVESMKMDRLLPIINDVTFEENIEPSWIAEFEVSPLRMKAQIDDGTSDQMKIPTDMTNNASCNTVALGTTGEYCKSLRPLLKRFINCVNYISNTATETISYNPVANYNRFPDGFRATGGVDTLVIPESWISMISNLYRFTAGGHRLKAMINLGTSATTSLLMANSNNVQINTPILDPSFVTYGHINNAVEVNVPFYSNRRAHIVGTNETAIRGASNMRIEGQTLTRVYEAGSDDLNFWYTIGPPVTCIAIKPNPGTIQG